MTKTFGAPRPAAAPTHGIRSTGVASIALAASVFATGFAKPTLVQNFVVGDVVVLGLITVLLVDVVAGTQRVSDVARALAVPITLIVLGSLIAVFPVGLNEWSLGDFLRDAAVGMAFLAAIDVARREGLAAIRLSAWALAAAGSIVSIHVLFFDSSIRAQATFVNPNVAGHFLATAFVGLLALPMRLAAKAPVLALVLAGTMRTSSFGALLQILLGGAYLLLRWLRSRGVTSGQLAVLAVGAVALATIVVPSLLPEENTETSGLSSERLERSSEGRFAIWSEGFDIIVDHPLGVGAGSTNGLGLLAGHGEQEFHNEPLAYLVERGVLGLAGYLALCVALWRLAPRGGGGRALLLGFGASTLVREPSHYRHLWIVLAVVLVADTAARARTADA